MGRFSSAFAFLFVLVLVLGSAGCGDRFEQLGSGTPPTQAELASQALDALRTAESAHVVLDAQVGAIVGTTTELGFHFDGDISSSRIAGDGIVRFPGGTLGARLLVGDHDVYVRFAGTWYQAHGRGIADALAKAHEEGGETLGDLLSPAGIGEQFAELFEGEVREGPVVDGASTWEFEGHLRPGAVARYLERAESLDLTDNDRRLLDTVSAAGRLFLVVGQDDQLPRKVEVEFHPPAGLHFDSDELASGNQDFSFTLELSQFGKDVGFTAPKDARPLDELGEQLLSAFE
ncbi:MAG TPA: hypothetical protein VFW80_01455 [Gaiellaceae bacterium]|nr:hypothetical protein [Gaiellaceae bacterium]